MDRDGGVRQLQPTMPHEIIKLLLILDGEMQARSVAEKLLAEVPFVLILHQPAGSPLLINGNVVDHRPHGMVKEPAIMRRLDLRSTFRRWANLHEVPGINRDAFCGRFRSLPRSGCTPEPRVSRVSRRHPGCTTCPGRIGRVQGNGTRRRSPSPQQPAVCLCPYGTPRISVSEHAGVAHDLRLDRSVMCGTKPRVRRRPLLAVVPGVDPGLRGTTASRLRRRPSRCSGSPAEQK